MTVDKGILIRNIYYMLSYAFQVLNERQYESIKSEKFDNIANLCAAILIKGVSKQLKQGLYQTYIEKVEPLTSLCGKINMPESIKLLVQHEQRLSCEFDELSIDNIYNQIIRCTLTALLSHKDVEKENKQSLKRLSGYFNNVSFLEGKSIDWSRLQYRRDNRNYMMIMNICYFVWHDLLPSTDEGTFKTMTFGDETMSRLYEKFILEFYRKHFPELHAMPSQVKWDLKEDPATIQLLPTMNTDIMLTGNNSGRTLIIDAKYYGKTLSTGLYGKKMFHTNNLYQIYAYVKNHDAKQTGNTSGMLLYAKTEEDITPNESFTFGANRFSVKTLDLNCQFEKIKEQLSKIAVSL